MKEYRKITMKHYCVEKLMCCRNTCKNEFVDIIPFGYELICFDMASGEKVFLPTYGENGYLDLLKKLVPEWNDSKEISFKVSKLFEERINNYTPCKVSYHNKTECMKCHSTEIVITKRIMKENYPIRWIEIDTMML